MLLVHVCIGVFLRVFLADCLCVHTCTFFSLVFWFKLSFFCEWNSTMCANEIFALLLMTLFAHLLNHTPCLFQSTLSREVFGRCIIRWRDRPIWCDGLKGNLGSNFSRGIYIFHTVLLRLTPHLNSTPPPLVDSLPRVTRTPSLFLWPMKSLFYNCSIWISSRQKRNCATEPFPQPRKLVLKK